VFTVQTTKFIKDKLASKFVKNKEPESDSDSDSDSDEDWSIHKYVYSIYNV